MISKDSKLSTRRQCWLLGINRSTLYYAPVARDDARQSLDEELMQRIDCLHNRMSYIGSRKITAMLRLEGYDVCRSTVRRLMGIMCLRAVYPKANLSKRNFKEAIVPYLLRNYKVDFPNQVWSIDITYIKMARGHMYLTAIIDWYSRKIVGHYLSDTLDTDNVLRTVKEAVETYGVPAIINSDQGSQFTSEEYKAVLRHLQIRQSMDGKSRWADNIMIERWFRSLKTEVIYTNEYSSPRELRQLINNYVEEYNAVRPHEALGYDVPNNVYAGSFASNDTAA